MKIFKLMVVALVAMLGFTACDNDPEHIYDDHSADIAGTWSCFTENYAEVLIINADGTAVSYGVEDGEYWENVRGTVTVKENNITMIFEDDDNFTGHFDIIPGQAFSLFENTGERYVYNYCANDLADEIVGMWVCTQLPIGKEGDMLIHTFQEDGTLILTGRIPDIDDYVVVGESNYKVFGDLYIVHGKGEGKAFKFNVASNASDLGDMMTITGFTSTENGLVKETSSWLRIKQSLDLPNKSYDYNNIYVTNVKAKDAEFEFAGQTLNLANMDGRILDKMMKTLLFNVSFPSADKIVYNYHYNGENVPMPSPIVVDGNKMTIKKSVSNPACKDINVWTFQDKDNTQMHMYMPVSSFETFLANTVVEMMANEGKLDLNDAAAVKAIFDQVEAAIETINVSFIFKTAK
ncbi:MAG: hypothetical protein J6V13_00925 [Paludibacteraceae bacterium]|nr:hypothetical protein [Paludibacteraceae bacterium]